MKIVDLFDLTLLCQPVYINICLGTSFVLFSDLTFFTIEPTYLRELQFDKMDIAYIVSIGCSADLCSRILLTIIALCTNRIRARMLFMSGMIGVVISQIGQIIYDIFKTIYKNAVCLFSISIFHKFQRCGYCYIIVGILPSLALRSADYCVYRLFATRKVKLLNHNIFNDMNCVCFRYPSGIGLFTFIQGVNMITVGPAIGFVRDYTQNYPLTFSLLTFLVLTFAVSWSIEMTIVYYRNDRAKRANAMAEL